MTPGSGASAAEELAALRLGYARSLPGRLRRLRSAVRAWSRAPGDAELLTQAESLAHKLRGTSGSYGLKAFSVKAGSVEDALRRVRLAGATKEEAMTVIEPDLCEADELALEAVAALEAAVLGREENP